MSKFGISSVGDLAAYTCRAYKRLGITEGTPTIKGTTCPVRIEMRDPSVERLTPISGELRLISDYCTFNWRQNAPIIRLSNLLDQLSIPEDLHVLIIRTEFTVLSI